MQTRLLTLLVDTSLPHPDGARTMMNRSHALLESDTPYGRPRERAVRRLDPQESQPAMMSSRSIPDGRSRHAFASEADYRFCHCPPSAVRPSGGISL